MKRRPHCEPTAARRDITSSERGTEKEYDTAMDEDWPLKS
ncbi:hypothetical protein MRX96_053308, partial [Rhipicephalus microplus]